jgi:hypothetical protein
LLDLTALGAMFRALTALRGRLTAAYAPPPSARNTAIVAIALA